MLSLYMAPLPTVRAGEASAISGEERLQGNHRPKATYLSRAGHRDKANTRIAGVSDHRIDAKVAGLIGVATFQSDKKRELPNPELAARKGVK
jgi:hypothetical protein